ncbi:Cytochrome P450 monooxygenase nodW [Cladobotryum mycophilum]|uniref:Cytochrome P450 monooxygenase nodW n=1 Tax=Cladobotryum mycophilum TaxID=491253 RepID=A0ABR0SD51_9HYPO
MSMMDHLPLLVAVVAGALVIISVSTFYNDPLKNVPGPLIARLSRLWLISIDLSGRRSKTIHALHQKYGSVVRIGPREVSFRSGKAMKDLYGADNKFVKAPVYEAFGRESSFTIRDKKAHRLRQKRIAHVFSPASISAVEPLIHEQVEKLLLVLNKRVGQTVDMMEWFRIFALDVVGSVFLGQSFGGLDKEEAPRILHDLDDVFPSLWVQWQFSPIHRLLRAIPYQPLNRFLNIASDFYDKYGSEAFLQYVSRHGRSGNRTDLLTKLIAGTTAYEPLEDDQIINEMTNLIFAGTDTTSNTLTYMFYELARLPEWQTRLQKELDSVPFEGVPKYSEVMKLPILDAMIHEILRLYPAAPASLQRITLGHGGAVVDGVAIPQHGIASCQSYSTQRDPAVYPNPDSFDPGRWLSASEAHLNTMHEYILVWGKGQRSCLGKPMAYMELKVGVAAIMKKFAVEIGGLTVDDDMEMIDHFASAPKGKRCILRLQARQ